jgi:hypothetical protein
MKTFQEFIRTVEKEAKYRTLTGNLEDHGFSEVIWTLPRSINNNNFIKEKNKKKKPTTIQ